MLMGLRGSLANLFVTFLGEQFFVTDGIKPTWVTWVCTLVETDHECAGYRMQTMSERRALLAENENLLFDVSGQSLLNTVHDPMREIPSRPRIRIVQGLGFYRVGRRRPG